MTNEGGVKHDININIASSNVAPMKVTKNLGVMMDGQLSFSDHVASVSWLCHFALYNM